MSGGMITKLKQIIVNNEITKENWSLGTMTSLACRSSLQ